MKLKKMMLFVLPFILLLQGCFSHYIFAEHEQGYQPDGTITTYPLDKAHYNLYVRLGYAYHNQLLNSPLIESMMPAGITANDTSKTAKAAHRLAFTRVLDGLQPDLKIIEIEYLFVAKSGDGYLYISTVADRYQTRYNGTDFPGINRPNAADFRVFLFGQAIGSNQVRFKNKDERHTDLWTLGTANGNLTLHLIEEKRLNTFDDVLDIDDALGVPMVFIPIPGNNWTVIYRPEPADQPEILQDQGLLVAQDDKKYQLAFSFSTHKVSFNNKYIIYKP